MRCGPHGGLRFSRNTSPTSSPSMHQGRFSMMKLRHVLLGFTAVLALSAGTAVAADLAVPIDSNPAFNWKSYHDFSAAHQDLKGQTLSIFGPWTTRRQDRVREGGCLFRRSDRRDRAAHRLGFVRAADRHRHPGRQPGQHLDLPAARPRRRRCQQGLSQPAQQRCEGLAAEELCRRSVLGRSVDLQGQGRQQAALRLPVEGGPEEPRLVRAGELQGSRLQDPADDGRAEGADRADRQGRRHPVVHRHRLAGGDRLAGDRLGRGLHAAPEPAGRL